MKKYNYIYKITNLINNKIYIGKHSTNNLDDGYMGSGKMIKSAIHKYGLENFTKEYIAFCDTEDKLNYFEKFYIRKYHSKKEFGNYNLTDGGEGTTGYVPSEELKDLWSKQKSGKRISEEHKKKISDSNKGIKHTLSNYGRDVLRNNGRLAKHDNFKGHKHSENSKNKISESSKGENNGMYGRNHSDISKLKMSMSKKGRHRVWNEEHTKYHYEF